MNTEIHLPVMLRQVLEYLNPVEGGLYVDATVGLGGHSSEILRRLGPRGRLIGFDKDEDALRIAKERLGNSRVILHRGSFTQMLNVVGKGQAYGVFFDLGVSMLQLRQRGRGFSFLADEPLDMRMDRSRTLTAEEVVNNYPEAELRRILYEYGEERLAPKIAKWIVRNRPIRTTKELASLVQRVYGGRGRLHPATRTFQALRIEVNDELGELNSGLRAASEVLRQGGRLVVISYHSLEDRVVKNFLREQRAQGRMRLLTKKPLTPDSEEVRANPSARSAKLRAAERL